MASSNFSIQGSVLNKTTGAPISHATVSAYHSGVAAPLASAATNDSGHFNLSFSWAPDISVHSNRPDVHFKVVQRIDGSDKVIYNENPATQSRVNIPDVLAVTLRATEGVTATSPASPRPEDSLFIFTRVGVIGVNQIDTNNTNPSASGYAFPDASAAAPNSSTANSPFGSTLDIAGWFGIAADVYRYKIQYSTDGVSWNDIADPLNNTYYQFALGGGTWLNVLMGPVAEGGQTNLYKLPYVEHPGVPWIFPDLIARWDTSKVPNGFYTLRLLGFRVDSTGTTLIPSGSLTSDPAFGRLKLRVDNTPPTAKIKTFTHFPPGGGAGVPVSVCDILELSTGRLRVEFDASDPEGHLMGYTLNGMFGANEVLPPPITPGVVPPPPPDKASDNYAAHVDATRHWTGGTSLRVDYNAGGGNPVYTPAIMRTCAYQFRLNVSKRTTNGYVNIFSAEDTAHITIKRV
jgi:hypothetical protein